MKGAIKIHVLRKPGTKPDGMITLEVGGVPSVGEIINHTSEEDGHRVEENLRVIQVVHTPGSSQVHAEVWTEPVSGRLGDIWK